MMTVRQLSYSLACLVLLVGFGQPSLGGPLQVGSVLAQSGERSTGFLDVETLEPGPVRIPVSIIRGHEDGPVLSLIAGIHGYEYAPILALQEVAERIDPKLLKGTVIIVHVANIPSFFGRTIYYGPDDGKNLNRAFPGEPDGSVSDRIAYAITTQVIEQSDYLVDMHSGDGNEALRPYIYMPRTGETDLDQTIEGMARAFGIDHIVIDDSRISAPDQSVFTDMTALSRGIPAMTTEAGQLGSTDPKWISINVKGVMNLLRHLDFLPGEADPASNPVWLTGYEVIQSPENGIFHPAVEDGYFVAEGGILGHLVDLFGTPIGVIRAPFSGVVNYVVATPPVMEGEPLVMISRLVSENSQ